MIQHEDETNKCVLTYKVSYTVNAVNLLHVHTRMQLAVPNYYTV